jgi:pimeloyl-ACP methyl ester carboxylesterase
MLRNVWQYRKKKGRTEKKKELMDLVILAVLAVLFSSFLWFQFQSRSGSKQGNVLPITIRNVVLVHGAWADGSSWSEVIPLLQDAGIKVTAVQNPLTSLHDDVEATRKILDQQDGPTVLVGHSWGGTVITEVGQHPNVSTLVYVAALANVAGEDPTTLVNQFPQAPVATEIIESEGQQRLSRNGFLTDFANGIPPTKANVLYAVQAPIVTNLLGSKNTLTAWKNKPSWYSVSNNDRTISPDLERFYAERMEAKTIALNSGHLAMITHPQDIANLILDAACWIPKS